MFEESNYEAGGMTADEAIESVLKRPELYGLCRAEERDSAIARTARIEALHYKITRYGNDMYSIHEDSFMEDPSSYEDMRPFDLCAECYEVEKLICEECGGDAPIGHRSSWPCPTVRALTEGEPSE